MNRILQAGAALLIGFGLLGGAARADDLEDWRRVADEVLAIYEQTSGLKEYDAVAHDFDCQGLSLGSKQWPFRNGSIRKIFARLGKAGLARGVAEAMPRHGSIFLQAAEASLARRPASARRHTLALQRTSGQGCRGAKGVALLPGVEKELKAWLKRPEVLAAQRAEEQVISRKAIRLSACWARRIRDAETPNFHEYLFFYDYLVQNGGAWVEDLLLIDAFDQVNYRQYGKGEKELVSEKLDLIAQFYETPWRVAFAEGHRRDARRNAEVLKEAGAEGEIGRSEVGLLLVKTFRGVLGNTPFALISMNRGVISLLGRGNVNGRRYDIRDKTRRAGALDASEIPAGLSCRRG